MIDDDYELSKAASAFTAAIIKMYHDDIFNTIWNEVMDTVAGKLEAVHEYGLADDMRKLKKDVTN